MHHKCISIIDTDRVFITCSCEWRATVLTMEDAVNTFAEHYLLAYE